MYNKDNRMDPVKKKISYMLRYRHHRQINALKNTKKTKYHNFQACDILCEHAICTVNAIISNNKYSFNETSVAPYQQMMESL